MTLYMLIGVLIAILFGGGMPLRFAQAGGGGDEGDDDEESIDETKLTDEEKELIAEVRNRRLPAKQVLTRAARDYQREQEETSKGKAKEEPKKPTAAPADEPVTKADVAAILRREKFQENVVNTIRGTLKGVEAGRLVLNDPQELAAVEEVVMSTLAADAQTKAMTPQQFEDALRKQTKKTLSDRVAAAAKLTGAPAESVEKRLKAVAREEEGEESDEGEDGELTRRNAPRKTALQELNEIEPVFGLDENYTAPSESRVTSLSSRAAREVARQGAKK